MQVERVARYAKQNPADAWILIAASGQVIAWFAEQPVPSIAMYGRQEGIAIAAACTNMIPSMMAAVRRLVELGHKRIVMLTREERRKPKLSPPEQAFIDELEAAGITTGDYNLPDWQESREGLRHLVDELLRLSPPTAFIFQEADLYIAVRVYLADRGIIPPQDISLIVADDNSSFEWCSPVPSSISLDHNLVVRRVVQWVMRVAHGKANRRKSATKAQFIEGETIGPVLHTKSFRALTVTR